MKVVIVVGLYWCRKWVFREGFFYGGYLILGVEVDRILEFFFRGMVVGVFAVVGFEKFGMFIVCLLLKCFIRFVFVFEIFIFMYVLVLLVEVFEF